MKTFNRTNVNKSSKKVLFSYFSLPINIKWFETYLHSLQQYNARNHKPEMFVLSLWLTRRERVMKVELHKNNDNNNNAIINYFSLAFQTFPGGPNRLAKTASKETKEKGERDKREPNTIFLLICQTIVCDSFACNNNNNNNNINTNKDKQLCR